MTARPQQQMRRRLSALFALVGLLVALSMISRVVGNDALSTILQLTGPWLTGASLVLLAGCLVFCLTPAGDARIGGREAVAPLPTPVWLLAIYSVVTANGFIIWSAAEPVFHFIDNPLYQAGFPGSSQATASALTLTFAHWGTLSVTALAAFCITISRPCIVAASGPAKGALADQKPSRISARWKNTVERVHGHDLLATGAIILIAAFCLLGSASQLAEHLVQVVSVIDDLAFAEARSADANTSGGSGASLHIGLLLAIVGSAGLLSGGLWRFPRQGFALLGGIALAAGLSYLAGVSAASTGAPWEAAADTLSISIVKDFYRAIDLALAADIQPGLVDWQQAWSAHYARGWILSAPIYALVLVFLSTGRRRRHLVLAVFATNLVTVTAWLWVAGRRSVMLADLDPQLVTRVMMRLSNASREVASSLPTSDSTMARLDGLLAIATAAHWVAGFAVIAFAMGRFTGIDRLPSAHRSVLRLSLLLVVLSLLLALNLDINHQLFKLSGLMAPAIAAIVMIQVVRKISARTELTS